MTICAQQLQVADVGFPIAKTTVPSVARFGAHLRRRVDVVNVERAEIAEAASATSAPKLLDQSKLLCPPFGLLVKARAVLIAERFLAFQRTITDLARFPALLATAAARPAMGKIARLAAILPGSVSQSVGVHLGGLVATRANDRRGGGSHTANIAEYCGFYNARYFDIACRRIEEAYRQPRLFAEPTPKAVQEAML